MQFFSLLEIYYFEVDDLKLIYVIFCIGRCISFIMFYILKIYVFIYMDVEINVEVFYIICFLIRNGRQKIYVMSRDYI